MHRSLPVCALIALAFAPAFASPQLELKGLQPGMTREEAKTILPTTQGLTLGGVQPYTSAAPLIVRYRDERIEAITFVFRPRDFDQIREALQSKYAAMTCAESVLHSGFGAPVAQVACRLSDGDLLLTAQRYAGNIEMGSVDLRRAPDPAQTQLQKKKNTQDL